jgi:hypothetical protein
MCWIRSTHGPHHRERRVEFGQRLDRRARANRLVLGQHQQASDVVHRHDRLREAPFGARCGRLPVRVQRKRVDIGPVPALERGDQVCAHALRHEAELLVDARVHEPGATVAAHRPAAHALDPAADDEVFEPATDLRCSQVHRLEAGSAEAALRHAGHRLRPLGVEHGRARDVGALLAYRGDAAEHHVVDQCGVEPVARFKRLQQRAQQPHRRGLVQRTVLLALATRRTYVVEDECVQWVLLT